MKSVISEELNVTSLHSRRKSLMTLRVQKYVPYCIQFHTPRLNLKS